MLFAKPKTKCVICYLKVRLYIDIWLVHFVRLMKFNAGVILSIEVYKLLYFKVIKIVLPEQSVGGASLYISRGNSLSMNILVKTRLL